MSVTIKRLLRNDGNPFKLSLCAGQNGINNVVSWVYMLEDEYIVSYFKGSELAVTTCMKCKRNPSWLYDLVVRLEEHHVAGLIVNTGKFVFELPEDVIHYCEEHDFPIFTMPWEMTITKMLQDFCLYIINNQHENTVHDQAMRDAILKHDNITEYRDTLGRYYDLEGKFTVFCIYIKHTQGSLDDNTNKEYLLETRIRRLKIELSLPSARVGILNYENYILVVLNNAPSKMALRMREIILDIYADAVKHHNIFIGVGIKVDGIENIDKSYHRSTTAMRMAMYHNTPVIQFEDMGFFKILFSVKDDEVLYAYANEMLAPLDKYDEKNHNYVELLKTYIQQDRSLAGTADAMFMHRNTVNYQIQKMKELLGSPLKTLEDLFPYQVALAIRDMENHAE